MANKLQLVNCCFSLLLLLLLITVITQAKEHQELKKLNETQFNRSAIKINNNNNNQTLNVFLMKAYDINDQDNECKQEFIQIRECSEKTVEEAKNGKFGTTDLNRIQCCSMLIMVECLKKVPTTPECKSQFNEGVNNAQRLIENETCNKDKYDCGTKRSGTKPQSQLALLLISSLLLLSLVNNKLIMNI